MKFAGTLVKVENYKTLKATKSKATASKIWIDLRVGGTLPKNPLPSGKLTQRSILAGFSQRKRRQKQEWKC